jgi:hypothetical protein
MPQFKTHSSSQDSSFDASIDSETPTKYKTEICRNWSKGYCFFGTNCAFAHGTVDLRVKPSEEKPCEHFFQRGYCLYGEKCLFSHARLNYDTQEAKVHMAVPRFIEFV